MKQSIKATHRFLSMWGRRSFFVACLCGSRQAGHRKTMTCPTTAGQQSPFCGGYFSTSAKGAVALALAVLFCATTVAELRTVPITNSAGSGPDWNNAPGVELALQRTPPLYSTDIPAALEIQSVRLQLLDTGAKTLARLEWKDPTRDEAVLDKAKPNQWQSETKLAQSQATDRFFDACAVMVPAKPGDVFPSLQMGDAAHPVTIYYHDSTRGAAVMDASGRGTTRRTGATFPAKGVYDGGRWSVVMELPRIAVGTPVSFAVWNGHQQDRDGRKYFTVWYRTR
jgi:hypothetical protein